MRKKTAVRRQSHKFMGEELESVEACVEQGQVRKRLIQAESSFPSMSCIQRVEMALISKEDNPAEPWYFTHI